MTNPPAERDRLAYRAEMAAEMACTAIWATLAAMERELAACAAGQAEAMKMRDLVRQAGLRAEAQVHGALAVAKRGARRA